MPSSVVVSNLNIECVPVFPAKADTVLIVNADAILSGTIAFQCFQPVRWRRRQVSKLIRAIDLNQSSQRHSRNLLKSPDALLMEDRLRVFIAKGANQTTIILRIALYVKRSARRRWDSGPRAFRSHSLRMRRVKFFHTPCGGASNDRRLRAVQTSDAFSFRYSKPPESFFGS
jgi:hypothetical protein